MIKVQFQSNVNPVQFDLRSPSTVMKLERMGAAFPHRLSFMRVLIRRLHAEKAKVNRSLWEINPQGYGRAVYSVQLGLNTYSLVAFATHLEAENRSDRVIAEAWDASFALFDGTPTAQDLDRLEKNAPKQEAGRFELGELVISRANKSVRLFEHVVKQLSKGKQPDSDIIDSVGYLMRTTAVYGNGKFGFADRLKISERPELAGPFQAEMLTVWLIRGFTHDLVEHIAKALNPKSFVPLSTTIRTNLGIGNSTGLGMAPFLIKHAVLLNNWMQTRETALARVRAIENPKPQYIDKIQSLLLRAIKHVNQWNVADKNQMSNIIQLRSDLNEINQTVVLEWLQQPNPWDRLIKLSQCYSVECQELLVSLVLEPHGDLIDSLATQMADLKGLTLNPKMTLNELSEQLKSSYQWALDIDFTQQDSTHFFWYTSAEKLEPRLGIRAKELGSDKEMPLDIARQVCVLFKDLNEANQQHSVAQFLLTHPQHRHITRRIQMAKHHPYSEIQNNLIDIKCMPLNILRFKLSFFGASKFDPKSNLWTRVNMYQGAPLAENITQTNADDWWLPVIES